MKQWTSAEDLIKKMKADFKANGIKATIRRERGGWPTSLIINITTTDKDFKAFEDYAESFKTSDCRYFWVNDGRQIRYQDWLLMEDEAEKERIKQFTISKCYQQCREEHYQINDYNVQWYTELTDEFRAKLQKAVDICNSYNYDKSDAMTDYFDVGFYQHFELRNKGLKEVA